MLSDRAAFLHVGALLGTLMAANVLFHIAPAQQRLVTAASAGAAADARLPQRARLRAIHNYYLTLPVIALMLGSHFPGLLAGARGWMVIAVLLLGSAAMGRVVDLRFEWDAWIPALGATAAATLAALYVIAARVPAVAGGAERTFAPGEPVPFETAEAVIHKRCTVCHSASPADRRFGIAPGGVAFDEPAQIRALAARIQARTIDSHSMPPANVTWMTDQERGLLARWLRAQDR
jgi:uncharacterized membrane protein